jgi:UDP-N-acetylglucosamine 2-epimerase (non-hydrolysing)
VTTRVLSLFGTRPEVIKLAPVIAELERRSDRFEARNIASSQHVELLHPFARQFGIRIDGDLEVMRPGQNPSEVAARVLLALDPLLERERPDLVLVQGDTTTAMAGALAAWHRGIDVGHVEAGLRTGNPHSPFPEEMNRTLITRLARYHFAATEHNAETLRREGVPDSRIRVTGNPVVDALQATRAAEPRNPSFAECLAPIASGRLVVLTTHRRESFGEVMTGNLEVLRRFVEAHDDVSLAFPVHPNPNVAEPTRAVLGGVPRVHLLEPLAYDEFVQLLSRAWLIVSDSGGIQEEAPSLGKALLVLRENTERPEAIEAGVAKLVGGRPEILAEMLESSYADDDWIRRVREIENPFGRGDAAVRIVDAIEHHLGESGA